MSRQRYARATEQQKKTVNALTIGGFLSQRQIAKQVNLPVRTVGNIQRIFNCAPRSGRLPLPDDVARQILKLRRQRHGSPFIGKALGLPTWRVAEFFVERRFLTEPGKVGSRYDLTYKELRAMKRRRRQFEKELGREFAISECRARRFNRSWR